MEDAAGEVASALIDQGALGLVVLVLLALLVGTIYFAARIIIRLLDMLQTERSATNDVQEKRVTEHKVIIEAASRLEKRDDLLLTIIRDKGVQ